MAAANSSTEALDALIQKCLPEDASAKNAFDALNEFSSLAENSERYTHMKTIMKALAGVKIEKNLALTSDERNQLSVSYKNVVGALRSAWRSQYLSGEEQPANVPAELMAKYKGVIEAELKVVCEEVLDLLKKLTDQLEARKDPEDDNAVKENMECKVFYLKMRGDYFRYLTEVFKDNSHYQQGCRDNYSGAMTAAEESLAETHPTRLGLALNYSVCYYEILEQKDEAIKLAKDAFDKAIEKLDSLNDTSYKDSTLIMQLLRDNLTIWNSPTEEDGAENDGDGN